MSDFLKFPSIQQFKNVVEEAQKQGLKIETFTGTVKLHGTNGAVVYNKTLDTIHYQSRNRILSRDSDNMEFYKVNQAKESVYRKLFESILLITPGTEIALFGEWCGGKLSSTVAIGKLPRMFVIFAIKVDNRYLKYSHIHSNENDIYNIYQFPTFKLNINFEKTEATSITLQELTEKIDKNCPVASHFGIEGTGEGIVWTMNSCEKPLWWFKTKGNSHRISVKNKIPTETQTITKEKEFADEFVTTERLEQGIAYLKEQNIECSIKNIKEYNQFIVRDIIKEEKDVILKNNLNERMISKFASKISSDYYKTKIFGW